MLASSGWPAAAEPVFLQSRIARKVAQQGERVREAGNGGLGQAGAIGDLTVAEHRIGRRERAQYLHTARQVHRELAVIGKVVRVDETRKRDRGHAAFQFAGRHDGSWTVWGQTGVSLCEMSIVWSESVWHNCGP